MQSVHRIRERIVKSRSSLAHEIRGILGEYGITVPVGIKVLINRLPIILADGDNLLTSYTRGLLQELIEELNLLTIRLKKYNKRVEDIHKNHPIAQRLTTIPGVGPMAATAIIASVADPTIFKNGREFASFLGLVPRQSSSGGKQKLLGISKRGDKYIRTMLIHGARVAVAQTDRINRHSPERSLWINKLRERRGYCKATVALANKNARVIWALMNKGEDFKAVA